MNRSLLVKEFLGCAMLVFLCEELRETKEEKNSEGSQLF